MHGGGSKHKYHVLRKLFKDINSLCKKKGGSWQKCYSRTALRHTVAWDACRVIITLACSEHLEWTLVHHAVLKLCFGGMMSVSHL